MEVRKRMCANCKSRRALILLYMWCGWAEDDWKTFCCLLRLGSCHHILFRRSRGIKAQVAWHRIVGARVFSAALARNCLRKEWKKERAKETESRGEEERAEEKGRGVKQKLSKKNEEKI